MCDRQAIVIWWLLTRLSVTYMFQIFPELNLKKTKRLFTDSSHAGYQKFPFIGQGRFTKEFENQTRTTVAVLQYYNVFPILCLYFVSIPRTVTREVIGSSTPRFQSVNTFQARKENNRSFTHWQAPRRSKIISRELCAIVEERGFSGKLLKCF